MKDCNCKSLIQIETNAEKTSINIAGDAVAICIGTTHLVEGLFQNLEKEYLDILSEELIDIIEEHKERA